MGFRRKESVYGEPEDPLSRLCTRAMRTVRRLSASPGGLRASFDSSRVSRGSRFQATELGPAAKKAHPGPDVGSRPGVKASVVWSLHPSLQVQPEGWAATS